jgi:glycine cleavage system H protein
VEEQNLRYTSDHIWVRVEHDGNTALVGITDVPLKSLQQFASIRFPEEGRELSRNEVFGAVEDGSDVLFSLVSPLTGEVLSVNEDIEDAPEVLLEDNYEEGWLIRLLIQSPEELEDLLTGDEYRSFISDGLDDDGDYDPDDDEDDDDDDDDGDDYYDDDDDDDGDDDY